MRVPLASALSFLIVAACAGPSGYPRRVDEHTVVGARDYLRGYPAVDPNGSIRVVVEIPAGTTAKWEVDKGDGALRWEIRDGAPRVVRFLGYPGNYGMVPRTLLAEADGGDGDPLDVLVLGDPVPRGTVVRARVVGVLRLLDGGEQDDKLIAVRDEGPFEGVTDLAGLRRRFPGVTEIVETWFRSYKGPGHVESLGYSDVVHAQRVLRRAIDTFERANER